MNDKQEQQDARDREAFERLRMYFRLNFTDGASDAAFLKWCADMVKQAAREWLYKTNKQEDKPRRMSVTRFDERGQPETFTYWEGDK